jgi:hypothetical protein
MKVQISATMKTQMQRSMAVRVMARFLTTQTVVAKGNATKPEKSF